MNRSFLTTAAFITLFATSLANASDDEMLGEARDVAKSLPPKLIPVLQAEIKKSGPEGAISVCRDISPKIAAEISEQTGWKVKRVSLKPRNQARATPDEWEKAALEDFDKRAASGESPAKLDKGERVGNEYRYVKALPVKQICLQCHGPVDQLSPAVRSALDQNYPNDRATGYSVGQIRGAISVRKAL